MKYEIRVSVQMVQLDDQGCYLGNQNGLSVMENANLEAADFGQIAAILGRFHDLVELIRTNTVN